MPMVLQESQQALCSSWHIHSAFGPSSCYFFQLSSTDREKNGTDCGQSNRWYHILTVAKFIKNCTKTSKFVNLYMGKILLMLLFLFSLYNVVL